MQREYKISLSQEYYSDVIYLSQYDSDYNIVFNVIDKYSAASVDGYAAKFTGLRNDGLGFTFESTGSGTTVTFTIDTTLTAVSGTQTGEIIFYDDNGLYFGSANVQIIVEPAAQPDGTIDADTQTARTIQQEVQAIVDAAAATVTASVTELEGEVDTNTANIATNSTAIGTLTNLTTDTQTDLVSAINEVDAHADTNAAAISSLNAELTEIEDVIGGGNISIIPTAEYENLGKYWYVNGDTMLATMGNSSNGNYNACSPIDISELKDGTEVKILASISGANSVAITNESMVAIDYVNGNNATSKGYTAGSVPQIITFIKTVDTKYIISTIRSYYYTGVADFTVYGTSVSAIEEIQNDIIQLQGKTDALISGKKISVNVSDNSYTILSEYGNDSQLKRTLSYGKRTNGLFEFENAYIVENGNQTLIKDSTDDITPMRIGANDSSRTVGANHGWNAFTVSVGSLTQEDVGSVWTDGTNNFILAKVDATYAYFIFSSVLVNGVFTFVNALPVSNMTHVNGATHTTAVDITDATGANLFPSVNNKKCKFYADDAEITEDGTYYCNKFTVKEQYDIMDYADIGDFLKANIGSELGTDAIKGCVRLHICYEFKETSCLVSTSFEALESVKFANCGVLQAIRADNTGKSLFRYLNGIGSAHHFNSENVVDITNDSTGYTVYPSDLANADIPTNRCVDIVKSNGVVDWGFCFGFLPDISRGANEYRKSLSQIWGLRSDSKKSYPVVFYGETKAQGYYADVIGYRNYLKPNLDATNITVIEVGESLYVIVDLHEQKTNYRIPISDKYMGKPINIIESVNFTLSSAIVGGNGVVFSTSNSYGCAVLKI